MKTEITVTEEDDDDLPEEFADQWNTIVEMNLRIDLYMMKYGERSPDEFLNKFFNEIKQQVLCHYYNRYPPEEIN